jgi:hypothetical protein
MRLHRDQILSKVGQDAIIFIKKISKGMENLMISHLREQPICKFYVTESNLH